MTPTSTAAMTPSSTHVLAVVGASGGLGASTLALALGHRLGATGPPGLVVDLDLARGGLDVTAGIEHLPGRRWAALAGVRGRVAPGLLVPSLPGEGGCRVLSAGGPSPGPVGPEAVRDVLASVLGAGVPVVLDVPAGSALLADVLAAGPTVLVLTSLRTRGLADADALVEHLLGHVPEGASPPDLRLVTRGARAPGAVVDDVVAHLGLGHVGHLLDDPAVPRSAERGQWPGTTRDAVRRCADAVLAALAPATTGVAS